MVKKEDIKTVTEVASTAEIASTIDTQTSVDASRRQFFKHTIAGAFGVAAALNIMPAGLKNMVYAAGSDAPEITEVKIGFIPLTDCAPIVVAAEMGFDKKIWHQNYPCKASFLGSSAR